MAKNKQFLVRVPETEESSDYIINAATVEEAAQLYVEAALIEGNLSVDEETLNDAGCLALREMPKMTGAAGLVSWNAIAKVEIRLEDVPAWRDRPSKSSGLGISA